MIGGGGGEGEIIVLLFGSSHVAFILQGPPSPKNSITELKTIDNVKILQCFRTNNRAR